MFERLRQRDWETSTYLLLAVANLIIGCYLIHTSPVDIAADTERYYETAKALVGKGGELSYDKSSWGYPILLILTGFPWTRWPVITQVVQVCMASTIPYFVGSSLSASRRRVLDQHSRRLFFVLDSANGFRDVPVDRY